MFALHDYQQQMKAEIFDAWNRLPQEIGMFPNVMGVAPTGSGKTVLMSDIFREFNAPACSIAHRQELVSQISVAMAANEIEHNIIASEAVIKFCIQRHVEELGRAYHHPNAPVGVAGVQTIIRRKMPQWANSVRMWTLDEAHHALPDNSWGQAIRLFEKAMGLGLTASPLRTDRKPLGREQGGLFDHMILGPSMRDLINRGRLSDYRIFAPKTSIDRAAIKVSESTGDFNQHSLREESHKSTITGDLVESYLKFASGKRGISFVVDVETAKETAQRFEAAGVPATAVSAKTPDRIRQHAIERFKRGEILQLVNVDLFGEGFDVPAVEVVSMGRPTESFGLYLQQFGRALRVLEWKERGIIIDHVGNVVRHGLPDAPRTWSLHLHVRGRGKANDPNVMKVTTCPECFSAYEAFHKACPYCGHIKTPDNRSAPEFVDGDITEFSPELLARLRGEIDAIEFGNPAVPVNATPIVNRSIHKHWAERQKSMHQLRNTIDLWAGIETTVHDRTVDQAYRSFYLQFGVDVFTAQTLPRAKMDELTQTINERLM